jgi:hypothetical protein
MLDAPPVAMPGDDAAAAIPACSPAVTITAASTLSLAFIQLPPRTI